MLSPAFSAADQSVARAVLVVAQESGMETIAEVLDILGGDIPTARPATVAATPGGTSQRLCPTIRLDGAKCPGVLQTACVVEGLRRVGCKICQYSEVV